MKDTNGCDSHQLEQSYEYGNDLRNDNGVGGITNNKQRLVGSCLTEKRTNNRVVKIHVRNKTVSHIHVNFNLLNSVSKWYFTTIILAKDMKHSDAGYSMLYNRKMPEIP